jgi:hypothetical protein
VTFEQTFQAVRGAARAGGRPARIESARLTGDELRFTLVADLNGRSMRQELAGRISGDTIRGKTGDQNWQATRTLRGKIDFD